MLSPSLLQVLRQWSTLHGLPVEPNSSWRGATIQQLQQHVAASTAAPYASQQQQQYGVASPATPCAPQEQQQQQGTFSFTQPCQQALLALQEAVQHLVQQQQQPPAHAAAGAAGGEDSAAAAAAASAWCDLGLDAADILKADSLLQLEAVLGPQGGWAAEHHLKGSKCGMRSDKP